MFKLREKCAPHDEADRAYSHAVQLSTIEQRVIVTETGSTQVACWKDAYRMPARLALTDHGVVARSGETAVTNTAHKHPTKYVYPIHSNAVRLDFHRPGTACMPTLQRVE